VSTLGVRRGGQLLPIDETKRWALFLCHRRTLVRFAQKLVRNADDAEDLVQDLGLLVIGHATGPRDDANFCAWCRGLIRNIAVHHWRSKARRFDQASPVGFEIIEYPEDEHQANPEDKAHVRKRLDVLSTLDDRALELLRRRYVLGETSGEIARSLQRSPDSIRMQLMRLRASLRDAAPADEAKFAEETTTAG
jgi:RNA polymerase sigma factor (sigma-70 family)